MQNAKILNEKEVREAIAEKYNLPVECIGKMRYSYVIMAEPTKDNNKKEESQHGKQ